MKRTYRMIDGALVDVTNLKAQTKDAPFVLPDLDKAYNGGFESPIDGTFITSRSQLVEHNKRHGVIQTGDVRGEALRETVKKRMRYNPEARTQNGFSWVAPNATRARNLSEI